MKIEEISHGALTHPVQHIADGTAGDQAETNRLRSPFCSHGPDEKPGHNHHLDTGEHQWAIEEEFTEHPEADTRVETERQIEKWRDLDRARGRHHNIEDQPLRNKIDCESGSYRTTCQCSSSNQPRVRHAQSVLIFGHSPRPVHLCWVAPRGVELCRDRLGDGRGPMLMRRNAKAARWTALLRNSLTTVEQAQAVEDN